MLSTSARLLRLVTLLQARRHWSGADLAARLDIDARTLRRDIERLRELGYPVQASAGVGGGYRLAAGTAMPPVLLDDDEAVAVAVALRVAAGSVRGIDDTAIGLLAKLDQLLPARLRRRASALHAMTISLPLADAATADGELVAALASACRDGVCVHLRYRDRRGGETIREVEPMRLATLGRRWYLVAWDRGRADWRTLRVDRIIPPLRQGERFLARRPPEDFATYVARAISFAPFPCQVRLRLHGSAAELAERIPAWCGVIEAIDDSQCLFSTGGDSVEAVIAQIAVAGVDFSIIDAGEWLPALRAVVTRLGRGLAGA